MRFEVYTVVEIPDEIVDSSPGFSTEKIVKDLMNNEAGPWSYHASIKRTEVFPQYTESLRKAVRSSKNKNE